MQLKFSRLLCLPALLLALAPALASAKSRPKPKTPVLAPQQLAGALVPAFAESALLLDGAQAPEGIVAMLEAASLAAPSLAPKVVSQDLTRALGVDPLGSGAESGLAADGARAMVFNSTATGFSAPVADEARAKQVLQQWLTQLGPVRPSRGPPLKGALTSGGGAQVRAGMVAQVAGSLRLLTASGRDAGALLSQLAHLGFKKQDTAPIVGIPTIFAALLAVPGPVRLWINGEGPIPSALLSIAASRSGLGARGLLLPSPGAPELLEGSAPPESACEGATLFCARAAPGPALRLFAPLLARELIGGGFLGSQRDALAALIQTGLDASRGPLLLRIEGLDARVLSAPEQLLAAMPSSLATGASLGALALPEKLPAQWSPLPAPRNGILLSPRTQLCLQSQASGQPGALWLSAPCGPVPAHLNDEGGAQEIAARLDTQALARALGPLSAFDALRGSLAAGAVAVKLLWGDLLSHSGPVELSVRPWAPTDAADPNLKGALDLSFAWPLSTAAGAK